MYKKNYIAGILHRRGFTLAELLIAIMISGIILAAVASLAFAMGSANDSANDTSEIQARLRFTTLKINELIRNCKLICSSHTGRISIWRADDDGDDLIDVEELTYIDSGASADYISLVQFPELPGFIPETHFTLSQLQVDYVWQNKVFYHPEYITLISSSQCTEVLYLLDAAAPNTQKVNIRFKLIENGIKRVYQINTALRAQASNLLDSDEIVSDDD